MKALIAAVVLVLTWSAMPASARGQTVAVGLYAPSAPFEGPVARLDFASRLATEIARRVGADKGIGRVYSSASTFAAAVRRREIQYAVIDSGYSAARRHPYKILATAVRRGATESPWVLVTNTGANNVMDLQGKSITLPRVGSKDKAFLGNVLLHGEVSPSFFGSIQSSPDALSAVAAVKLGRATAAFVPSGLGGELRQVFQSRPISWPVLVALPSARKSDYDKVTAAATSFSGGSVLSGFRAGNGNSRALSRRFSRSEKRGAMAVPPPRLGVRELVTGRTFRIARPSLDHLLVIDGGSGKPVDKARGKRR